MYCEHCTASIQGCPDWPSSWQEAAEAVENTAYKQTLSDDSCLCTNTPACARLLMSMYEQAVRAKRTAASKDTLPDEVFRRIRGALFFGAGFKVTRNKLLFRDNLQELLAAAVPGELHCQQTTGSALTRHLQAKAFVSSKPSSSVSVTWWLQTSCAI